MLPLRSLPGAIAAAVGSLLITVSSGVSAARTPDTLPSIDIAERAVPAGRQGVGTYLIQLQQAPAAAAYARAFAGAAPNDAAALARARIATRARVAEIGAAQAGVLRNISTLAPAARVLYTTKKAMNGIVVEASAADAARLRDLPGVRAVTFMEPEYPTLSTSVPFIGAPAVWDSLGLNATGAGVSIGIIDTGVDYQHPAFGGTGVLADYQANNRTVITETGVAAFPTARVVGGFDFVGDAYNGSTVPTATPDPDPMDCLGHGMHVASTAAGGGVKADGTPFTGPFDSTINFGALRIGPGVAPEADVYALRVFGCGGSTNFTSSAIEWAMDPNNDDDLSDHLDVINMSLGSNFGSVNAATAISSDNAAAAGVIVVASAGNAGDTFAISGAPGSSTRTITVANVSDGGNPGAVITVNSPPAIAGPKIALNNAFTANFPPLPSGQTAEVVAAIGTGAVPVEGCTSLSNAAALAGKIAIARRGTCGFAEKAQLAQGAGAIGVIIYNNVDDPSPPGLGGAPTIAMTIPVVSTTLAVGTQLISNGTVVATLAGVPGGDIIAGSSSRGPRLDDLAPKPDVAAPGTSITAAQTGVTCTGAAGSTGCLVSNGSGYIPDGQPLTISGTSMAAPHVAGTAALLRELNPQRSVEEIKAAIMNGALHDVSLGAGGAGGRMGTSRVGAGRLDALEAGALEITAFNADQSGGVSVGFDGGVFGNSTQTRTLRLVNHGITSSTLALSFDTILDVPGVQYTLPNGPSVTLAAGASALVPIQMVANAAAMNHPRDPTLAATQTPGGPLTAAFGALARHWLAEESALLVVREGGTPIARVPVYSAPRPQGSIVVPSTIDTAGATSGTTSLPISGVGICSAIVEDAQCNNGTFDALTMVSGVELQYVGPRDTNEYAYNDIRYAGAATDGTRHYFAVGMYGRSQSAYANTYEVEIDVDSNGTADRILGNGDGNTFAQRLFGTASIFGQDNNVQLIFNVATNGIATGGLFQTYAPNVVDMRINGADVGYLSAAPAALGLASTTAPFRYRVKTCFAGFPLCTVVLPAAESDSTGWISYNPGAPGARLVPFLFDAQPGGTVDIAWNTTNLAANGSLGVLLLHHQNRDGMTQQVVTFANAVNDVAEAASDVAVTFAVSDASPDVGDNVVFTATMVNNGPTATAVQGTLLLPQGLTYVSDNGAGAYDPISGQWSLAAPAVGVVASLQLTASVDRSGPINTAFDAMGAVADPAMVNNHADVTTAAANTSDLGLAIASSATSVVSGDDVTLTLTLTNAGPDTAYNVNVSTAFPGVSAQAQDIVASAGVFDALTGVWNVASVANGATETLELTYTLTQAGSFDFGADASIADNDPNVPNDDEVTITVGAGAPSELVALTGDGQSTEVGTAFGTPFSVRVDDANDNPIVGATVTFTAPATGPSGIFATSATVVTNAAGIATAPAFTANATAGAYVVTATSGALSAVTFDVTNVRAATTTDLVAGNLTPGTGVAVEFTATVSSSSALPIAGTVDFTTDAGATLLCDDVPVDANGAAVCSASFPTGSPTVVATFAQTGAFESSTDSVTLTVAPLPALIFADGFED